MTSQPPPASTATPASTLPPNTNSTAAQACAEALDDVRRLFAFASREGKVMDRQLIADFVRINKAQLPLSTEDELTLWTLLDRLSSQVWPVTATSLRLMAELEGDQKRRPGLFRARWRDCGPRKVLSWAQGWMLRALFLVVTLQIYALVGSMISSDVVKLTQERDRIEQEVIRINQLAGGETSARDSLAVLQRQMDTNRNRLQANYSMLDKWNDVWQWALAVPVDLLRAVGVPLAPAGIEDGSSDYQHLADEQAAQSALQAISLYLLPMLYGLLGTTAFVLRRLGEQLEESTFTETAFFRYGLRMALGAVMGAIISLFYSPETTPTLAASLPLIAAAFLAGYSVELVFAAFDGQIERLRQRFAAPVEQQAQAAAQSPAPSVAVPSDAAEPPRKPAEQQAMPVTQPAA